MDNKAITSYKGKVNVTLKDKTTSCSEVFASMKEAEQWGKHKFYDFIKNEVKDVYGLYETYYSPDEYSGLAIEALSPNEHVSFSFYVEEAVNHTEK